MQARRALQVPTHRVVAVVRRHTGSRWQHARSRRMRGRRHRQRAAPAHDDRDDGHVRERVQRLRALRLRALAEAAPHRGGLRQHIQRRLPGGRADGARLPPPAGGGQHPAAAQGGGAQEAGVRPGRHQRGAAGAERALPRRQADVAVERAAADHRADDHRHAGGDAVRGARARRRARHARRAAAVHPDGDVPAADGHQREQRRARRAGRVAADAADAPHERRHRAAGDHEHARVDPARHGHGGARQHRRRVARPAAAATAAGQPDADVPVEQRRHDGARLLPHHVAHAAAQQHPRIAGALHSGGVESRSTETFRAGGRPPMADSVVICIDQLG